MGIDRNEIVQNIKDLGQYLIDNAEDMVEENAIMLYKYIINCNVAIVGEIPYVTIIKENGIDNTVERLTIRGE